MQDLPLHCSPITEQDVRDIARLVGRVIDFPGDIHAKRKFLIDGLCTLLGAGSWAWCLSDSFPAEDSSSGRDGVSPAYRVSRLPPLSPRTLAVSLRSAESGGISGICICRDPAARPFGPREERIADIVLTGVPWLYLRDFPDSRHPGIGRLYPRHRTVLHLLCEGWSRKKIAAHLQLSLNTVHGYVKAVFKHFGVHSQAELLSRVGRCGLPLAR